MKTQGEIEDRVRTLLVEELDRRVRAVQHRLPTYCVHNHRQPLDVRKRVEDEPNPSYNRVDRTHLPVVNEIGLCMLGAENPESWQGTICEDPVDAQRCPDFTPHQTKQQVYDTFKADLEDYAWIRLNLPELYGLLWVLETERPSGLPWWKRLWFRFLRLRVEPLGTNYDLIKALPSVSEDSDGVHGP